MLCKVLFAPPKTNSAWYSHVSKQTNSAFDVFHLVGKSHKGSRINWCHFISSIFAPWISFKTEFTRKLSNFNSQWTKTLYQNNLKNISSFFTFFQGLKRYLFICNNYFSWEPKKINVIFHKNFENTGKIVKISCLTDLTFIFSGSHERFSLVLIQMTNFTRWFHL